MVRERDRAREDAHHQTWVELHVGVRLQGARELLATGRNEGVVGFEDVEVLDRHVALRLAHQVVPSQHPILQLANVVESYNELVVLDDVKRAHRPPRLRADDDVVRHTVPVNTGVDVDCARVLCSLQHLVQLRRLAMRTHQIPVNENLCEIGKVREVPPTKRNQTRVDDLVSNAHRVGVCRDVCGQGHVLDDADARTLGRLRRTDDAELRGVEPSRLHELSVLFDWRVDAPHVRYRRKERHPVQHLRDAVPSVLVVLQPPDSGAERVLEAGVDDGGLDDPGDVVLVYDVADHSRVERPVGVELLRDHLLDVLDQFAVVLSKNVGKEHSGSIHAFIDVGVAVVHSRVDTLGRSRARSHPGR